MAHFPTALGLSADKKGAVVLGISQMVAAPFYARMHVHTGLRSQREKERDPLALKNF